MNRITVFILFFLIAQHGFAQDEVIEWSKDYELKLSDFKNSETKIDSSVSNVFIQSGVTIELGFQMSNLGFMFRKHFNDNVSCKFYKKTALLMAVDSLAANKLIQLSQFDFDLSELYTRKIRKELYENKKTFSKANFFESYFNKMIQERNALSGKIYKDSDFGNNIEMVETEHQKILDKIEVLADFCRECKPPKRAKKSR